MNPITIIALAVLAIAAPVGIWGAVSMWRLGRDLDRDHLARLRRERNELEDSHAAAVLGRQIGVSALQSIATASRQRGDMATARVAEEALRSIYARVR